ncbi:NADP-dependent oxidoreductase [Streptomyces cocklensis]|uniref:NADPH:quinone reductase n=1 Tax=Actinacidiphila cocklensis TaxID=887465 RepID=A0A9W4DKE1_9ACTN|nr:NADP-dependent oxidoreductase [Actinacidiphila cocklensis]MDD1060203.1 NADP-dependent oxidoreductase [Actinacidiphila cocklensis]WSX76634.1 NADP-dependent oxidoreductase [Streptomyces sp. NBC_00899]CAG6391794.1 NADPH:quinone reductase [Actinacidiphila cocklensis]
MTKAKGIAFDEFGPAGVLHPLDIDVPEPGPGQVRIAVRAAGVNPLDHKIRAGYMNAVFPVELPHVPGIEAAGVVESVGEGVTGLAAGDEVFGPTVTGAYAGLALAEAAKLAAKPASLGFPEAAALPVAAETAYRALHELHVRPGETLIVHGAAGGVGILAVQFAVARGLRVVGTAGEANHEHLRRLGAIPVTYGDGLVDRAREAVPEGVDVAFDTTGLAESLAASVELTGAKDRVLTIGSPLTAGEYGVAFSSGAGPDGYFGAPAFAEALALHAAGTLDVAIHRAYPLAEAVDAQRASEAGHLRGKIVLLP